MGIDKPTNTYLSQGQVYKFSMVGLKYIYIYMCVAHQGIPTMVGWTIRNQS